MEKNWVSVFNTDKAYLAEIAKEVLLEEGIAAVTINKKDSNYLFGVVELYVERENAVRSKHLLKNIENSETQTDSNNKAPQ